MHIEVYCNFLSYGFLVFIWIHTRDATYMYASKRLYRYRMGDILQVTGFYNRAPQFKFARRDSMVLISIQVEATTEEYLLKGLNHVTIVLCLQPSEITAQPLVTKQKNRSHFYEYSTSKSSESSEMLEVVWTTEV
ncbi:hypothetical protein YC2023_075321 [Brassica napus]